MYLAAGTFRFADAGAGVHSVFDLQAMNNVRLSGAPLRSDGAPTTTLQVDGRHAFFSLGQCANVSLANLAFALTRVPVTLGTVVDVAANNFTVEVSSDELFPFPVSGGAASAAANDQWMYSIAALSGFDLSTWRMAENGVDLYKPLPLMVQLPAARNAKNMTNEKNTTVTVLGAGKATDTRIQVGGSFILRHTTYSWDGINIQASNGIELENVLMRSVAGMGLFASDTRDIRLSNVQIRRDAGLSNALTCMCLCLHANSDCFTPRHGSVCLLRRAAVRDRRRDAFQRVQWKHCLRHLLLRRTRGRVRACLPVIALVYVAEFKLQLLSFALREVGSTCTASSMMSAKF